MEEKVFVVFNTTSIGDVLVTNTLVQNIKHYYPDSKIIFVCNSAMTDIAKYQDGVSDVVSYNKAELKSLKSIWKFAKNFPYKKPFASFVTYSNERNLIISHLIGSRHIISHHKFFLWNTREKYKIKDYHYIRDRWGGMIEPLTGEHKNIPIKYKAPAVESEILQNFKTLIKPVLISPTSNFKPKDMSIEDCAELIKLLRINGYTPVLIGAGEICRNFNDALKKICNENYIDYVDRTNFTELANVMKLSLGCITVDTGTMHFANALMVPAVEVLYQTYSEPWQSDETLYPVKILKENNTSPDSITRAFIELCGGNI